MENIYKFIESYYNNTYLINKWTYTLMDMILLSDPFMMKNTLILSCSDRKVHIIKSQLQNTLHKNTIAMFKDYSNKYNISIARIYIVFSKQGGSSKFKLKYNFLPFFYLSKPKSLDDGDESTRGLLLPDYNFKLTKADVIIEKNKIVKPNESHNQFNFKNLFSLKNAIIVESFQKKEIVLLDNLFIPGVDYIILHNKQDENINYDPNSGYIKSKLLTKANILTILNFIILKYNSYGLCLCKQSLIKTDKLIGRGYIGKVYSIHGDSEKVTKIVDISPFYYTAFYEGVFCSILAENILFLRMYSLYLNNKKAYFIFEKADYTLEEYYKKRNMTKKIWQKIYNDIYAAMKEMHRLNILHNDLKPKNIMYSVKKDQFYIIDFGSATWLTEKNRDIDIASFSDIPNRLRINEILDQIGLEKLHLNVPSDLYTELNDFIVRHKYAEYLQTDAINVFFAMYYIKQNDPYINTYPNKLFKLIDTSIVIGYNPYY